MKRLFLIVLALLLLAGTSFGTNGTTVAVSNLVRGGSYYVTITATADVTSALFLPSIFNNLNNSGAYTNMLGKWLTSVRTIVPAAITAPTANYDIYIVEKNDTDDFVLTTPTLAIGSTTTSVSTVAFTYVINGVAYAKVAVADGTAPGNDVIVATKYGAVAFDIGANGTIDAIEATDQAAQQFTTAALAIAAVPACASDHVRLGYVTASKSDGTFTFGAGGTALNAANTTVAYTSTIPAYDVMGGRLVNRSATATEEVYSANSNGDNQYVFIKKPIMVVITGNSVVSAVVSIELNLN